MRYVDIATGTKKMEIPDEVHLAVTVRSPGKNVIGTAIEVHKRGEPGWEDALQAWAFRNGYMPETWLESPPATDSSVE